ncbi:MAG: 50S ribosomal protein L30 [Candidatus Odinarchaeota archaeon]
MEATKVLSVIRIRGTVDVNYEIEDTMKMLRLHKPNHLVLLDDRKSYVKMLHKINNYIAWGEVSADMIEKLLREKGRLQGNKPLTDEYLQSNSEFKSVKELAKRIHELKASLTDVKGLKPVFRLHPPMGGFKGSKKKPYSMGGLLGYHGKEIENLINKML